MYKTLIIFLIFLNLTSYVLAKEIRSRFGFYYNIPDSLAAVQDLNLDDLLEAYEGTKIDKNALNDLMAGIPKTNMNVEYFFPKNLDPTYNSINLNIQEGDINDINSIGLKNLCPLYQQEYSKLFKKKIKQYECKFTNEFSPKFSPVIYLIHDGLNNYLIQYQFQVRPGFATLTVGCDTNQNCNTMNEYAKNIILSIRN